MRFYSISTQKCMLSLDSEKRLQKGMQTSEQTTEIWFLLTFLLIVESISIRTTHIENKHSIHFLCVAVLWIHRLVVTTVLYKNLSINVYLRAQKTYHWKKLTGYAKNESLFVGPRLFVGHWIKGATNNRKEAKRRYLFQLCLNATILTSTSY